MTLRIERSVRQGITVFTLSGNMKAEEVAELKTLFDADYRTIVLDLRDVRLAGGWDEAGELSSVRPRVDG